MFVYLYLKGYLLNIRKVKYLKYKINGLDRLLDLELTGQHRIHEETDIIYKKDTPIYEPAPPLACNYSLVLVL